MRIAWVAPLLAALWLALSAVAAAAAEPAGSFAPPGQVAEGGWGYQLAHDMMSPFCPGRTLAQCPSGKAEELRLWILTQEAAGASREEVEAQLVARYGEDIWPAPPGEGMTGVGAYGIPILAVLLGGPLVFIVLRRLTRAGDAASQASAASVASASATRSIDAELAAEIDRELGEHGA